MNAPAGAVAIMPAIPPSAVTVPMAPVAQPRLCSNPQKRADAGLHIGHEVHRLQRGAFTGTFGTDALSPTTP